MTDQQLPHLTLTDDDLDEFALFWWGSDVDERTVSDVLDSGSVTAFARAVLNRFGNYE